MKALLAMIGNSITDAQESVKSNSRNLFNKVESITNETKESITAQSEEVGKKVQDELTEKLNTVFDEVLNEPLTDQQVQSLT